MRRTLVALAAVLVAGCSTTEPVAEEEPSTVAAVDGLTAEAVRLRTDEALGGRLHVRVTNTGEAGFAVTSAAIGSEGFVELPGTPVTAELPPGRVLDLPVPYGEPLCDADPLPAAALLTVVRAGGTAERVRAPLAGEVLGLVHREECAVRAVTAKVEVAVTDLTEEGESLAGRLVLTRRTGDEQVEAVALDRSVLVDVAVAGLPLELRSSRRSVAAPVRFTPASCHPHVLAEVKKPYVFPLTVRVGDADPVPVDLPLDPAAVAALTALVQRVCLPG